MKKDLISVSDLTSADILNIFSAANLLKNKKVEKEYTLLRGKTLAMIFQKPSTRTRTSFEVGMQQLGGHPLFLSGQELQLKRGETMSDTAKTLSRYVDILLIRAYKHDDIIELAKYSTVPVINGLSDLEHPCQVLSDIYTIIESKILLKQNKKIIDRKFWDEPGLNGIKLTYIGDGNNMANSILLACALMGIKLTVCTPQGYEPDSKIIEQSQKIAQNTGSTIELSNDPLKAVANSDVLYTDVWVSMGAETEQDKRKRDLKPYQVNQGLVDKAKKDVIIMHCLPAHRGEEITGEVLDGPRSIVFDQAENRLYVQKAIMLHLLNIKPVIKSDRAIK